MKRVFAAAVALVAFGLSAASAQTTAVGLGEASSSSNSNSAALSVSRSRGGNANAVNVFNTPSNTSTRVSGTTTQRNVPGIVAPGLAAAGIETCLGSVSGGAAFPGGGFSFGSTVTDHGCDTRLDARTLWAFGLKANAIARLCQKPEMQAALGAYCGQPTQQVSSGYQQAASASPSGSGRILLINGRTKQEQWCLDFNPKTVRCRRWE